MTESGSKFSEKNLQTLVGNLLRYGVLTAMVVVITGLILYISSYGKTAIDYAEFTGVNHPGVPALLQGVAAGNSVSIIELGVIILIATPIARIFFALIGFWLEKDRLYTFIALLILCIMGISIFTGAVG